MFKESMHLLESFVSDLPLNDVITWKKVHCMLVVSALHLSPVLPVLNLSLAAAKVNAPGADGKVSISAMLDLAVGDLHRVIIDDRKCTYIEKLSQNKKTQVSQTSSKFNPVYGLARLMCYYYYIEIDCCLILFIVCSY